MLFSVMIWLFLRRDKKKILNFNLLLRFFLPTKNLIQKIWVWDYKLTLPCKAFYKVAGGVEGVGIFGSVSFKHLLRQIYS